MQYSSIVYDKAVADLVVKALQFRRIFYCPIEVVDIRILLKLVVDKLRICDTSIVHVHSCNIIRIECDLRHIIGSCKN